VTPALGHCGVKRAQHGWLVERCQTPASPSKSVPNDGRSIRPPGALHTFHERRPATQAPGALCSPHSLYWTEGVLRGTVRNVLPPTLLPERGAPRRITGALTRRCSIRFCHRYYPRATKPLLIVLAGPVETPGRGRNESTSLRMLRAARGASLRTPLCRRGLCAAAFPFSGRRVVGDTASAKHTTPLVVALWGPRARRRTLTCNHYHSVTEGPSSGAPSAKRDAYRRPEAPSIECIEPELRARLVSECDL
jgi:hypothetical protein